MRFVPHECLFARMCVRVCLCVLLVIYIREHSVTFERVAWFNRCSDEAPSKNKLESTLYTSYRMLSGAFCPTHPPTDLRPTPATHIHRVESLAERVHPKPKSGAGSASFGVPTTNLAAAASPGRLPA